MRSLRARLLASVLGIAALGLVLLAAIVYAEQRSFLYDRLDDQARRAPAAMGRELARRGVGPADHGPGMRPGMPLGGPDEGRGGPGGILPPGTYGERRDEDGKVLGSIVVGFESTTEGPSLPADLEPGELRTIDGYRVFADRNPTGPGVTIAAVPLGDTQETLNRLLLVEGLVILGVLLALAFVGWVLVRVGLRPLDRIGDTAGRIAGGDLSHRVEHTDPRTEVGRLGLSLNAMLDRLEQAFSDQRASEDRLRRFLSDASHELRTPLSSIRGYAELYRMGATREQTELDRSMGRIEGEAARMGVLVEDLLTLARLDEIADAPHVEIDAAALARDAADDARATAPDRAVELRSNGPAPVLGDADQLRQVLANLVRNALVHTPDGTPIELSVGREDGDVVLEVRDHGPGLPADQDPQVIFERFWRAEAGRVRGKAGAGLGLAIVKGIVDAHDGTVAARNADGGGAAFTVRLPGR